MGFDFGDVRPDEGGDDQTKVQADDRVADVLQECEQDPETQSREGRDDIPLIMKSIIILVTFRLLLSKHTHTREERHAYLPAFQVFDGIYSKNL